VQKATFQRAGLPLDLPAALHGAVDAENRYFAAKRAIDLALTIAALVALAPLMLLVALAIRLDSRGPSFFVQQRSGARRRLLDGRTVWERRDFQLYKFRTMVMDADPSLHIAFRAAFTSGAAIGENGAIEKPAADPRVTRLGHFLRRTSLDELPQLFNVLKGDMSLVGPRPLPTYEVAGHQPWHLERLHALPGITGPWQVSGRGQVTFDEMVSMDIGYARARSLARDLLLIVLTVPAVLLWRGGR
jgi:lipopolysaccharide/colanic/teichoic acid biosynthesis glycosyltransferase